MSHPLSLAIIGGTGAEGRGLAFRFASAGVRVVIGSRASDRSREAVEGLRATHGELPLEAADNGAAVAACDVAILAVPFAHAVDTIAAIRGRFRPGSLLIDVTVPVTFEGGAPRLIETPEGSAAERVRAHLPPEVALAAAFKTIPASRLARAGAPLDCDEFVCGDSPESRARAMELLRLLPALRPIDAGPLTTARTIERMTLLAIEINRRYKVHDARFRVVGL